MDWEANPHQPAHINTWSGRYSSSSLATNTMKEPSPSILSPYGSGISSILHHDTQRYDSRSPSSFSRSGRAISSSELESKLLEEQHLRIKAEQEQTRLISVNHELERQLGQLSQEFKNALDSSSRDNNSKVRDYERQMSDLSSKLQILEELKQVSEAANSKFRGQAEHVIRTLEARQSEADESRRRAEEALARTVAAAHSKLTMKTSVVAAAEAKVAEEVNMRSRLQQQLEQSTLERLEREKQLADAKTRELELSTRLTEATQRADDLARRLQLTDSMSASVGPTEADPHTAVAQELDRIKRSHSKREADLTARLSEQNHLIRILRHALASANPGSAPPPLLPPFEPPTTTPSSSHTSSDTSRNKELQQLQHSLEERDVVIRSLREELASGRAHIDRLEEQRSLLLQKIDSTPSQSLHATRDMEESRKGSSADEAEVLQLRELVEEQHLRILTVTAQLDEANRRADDLAQKVTSTATLRAEMEESHNNELQLLEQVEKYEYSVQQLRARIMELEDFIVSADLAPRM